MAFWIFVALLALFLLTPLGILIFDPVKRFCPRCGSVLKSRGPCSKSCGFVLTNSEYERRFR